LYASVGGERGAPTSRVVITSKCGFLGVGAHDVAIPVSAFKPQAGKIVLPGATKDALKATPKFEYAKN
jgi:hypothetical protein